MSRWRFVLHDGQRLRDVGVNEDGTVHNPNSYPEDVVRAAVAGAEARLHARRSRAARQAAETRRRRVERQVYVIAREMVATGRTYGPRQNCVICGKGLGDPDSIDRGIGSECWGRVLAAIEESAPEVPAAPRRAMTQHDLFDDDAPDPSLRGGAAPSAPRF